MSVPVNVCVGRHFLVSVLLKRYRAGSNTAFRPRSCNRWCPSLYAARSFTRAISHHPCLPGCLQVLSVDVSDPRFRPRHFCAEPVAFGKATVVGWVQADGAREQAEAARLQHECAVQIRREAIERFGSVGRYAESIGQTPDRLRKVLRGEAVMQLEDLAAARVHLEVCMGVEQ